MISPRRHAAPETVQMGRYERKVPDWYVDDEDATSQADDVISFMKTPR